MYQTVTTRLRGDEVEREETVIEGLSTAIDGAKRAVADIAGTDRGGGPAVGEAGRSGFDDVFDLGIVGDLGSSLFEGAKEVLTGSETLGGAVGGALDSLGLPDWATDFTAAAVDAATANYAGAVEHGTGGIGDLAGAAGADGLEDFLEVAGDVTGMFHDLGGGGPLANLGSDGVLGTIDDLGEPGRLADRAGPLAAQGDSALAAADAFDSGDVGAAGSGTFEVMTESIEFLDGFLREPVDPNQTLHDVLVDGGELLEAVFQEAGAPEAVAELPAAELLDRVGRQPGDLQGMAGPMVGLAGAWVGDGGLAEGLVDSEAGRRVVEGLTDIAASHDQIGAAGVPADRLVADVVEMTGGFLEMAETSPEVTEQIVSRLDEMDSLGSSGAVRDVVGARIRG